MTAKYGNRIGKSAFRTAGSGFIYLNAMDKKESRESVDALGLDKGSAPLVLQIRAMVDFWGRDV